MVMRVVQVAYCMQVLRSVAAKHYKLFAGASTAVVEKDEIPFFLLDSFSFKQNLQNGNGSRWEAETIAG